MNTSSPNIQSSTPNSFSSTPADADTNLKSAIRAIRIEEFDYPLPDDRIARHPLAQRDACLLLEAEKSGEIRHHRFSDLPSLIPAGTLMIANETKVINARLEFFKQSGGRIEVFILEPFRPADYVVAFAERKQCTWTCMIGNLKRWKGEILTKDLKFANSDKSVILSARLLPLEEGETPSASRKVEFSWDNPDYSFAEIVELAGNIPIPPYLKRDSEASDTTDYQTVYSRAEGSVAAPTAGLHFTRELLATLDKGGVRRRNVTLHVGAGTFQPVKSDNIGDHPMHTEQIIVELSVIKDIISALESGSDILAIGTTSVRTIESLPLLGYLVMNGKDVNDVNAMHVDQWLAYDEEYRAVPTLRLLHALAESLEQRDTDLLTASTAIMIAPGFEWRIVNRIVTNFHQPQSTLLLLVGSFLGATPFNYTSEGRRWREIYDEALKKDYRFLSYGDACLFKS